MTTESRQTLFDHTHKLMMKRGNELHGNSVVGPYSHKVHDYLGEEYTYGLGHLKREIMHPLPREKWSSGFNQLYDQCIGEPQLWPQHTFYGYPMDCLISGIQFSLPYPFIPLPSFGYAVMGDDLIPCSFIVILQMTMRIEGSDDFFPEPWVFDPIALASGKNPDCYIGVEPRVDFVMEWMIEKSPVNVLLEKCVEQQDKIISEDCDWHREADFSGYEMLKNTPLEHRDSVTRWLLIS